MKWIAVGILVSGGAAASAQLKVGTLTYVFKRIPGFDSAGKTVEADISTDGRYIVFKSTRPSLRKGDDLNTYDVYRVDTTNGSLKLVNRTASGEVAPILTHSPGLAISARGGHVAFTAPTNLLSNIVSNLFSAYHVNLATPNVLTSMGDATTVGGLSADGNQLAYSSTGNPCDTRNILTGEVGSVAIPSPGTLGVFADDAKARLARGLTYQGGLSVPALWLKRVNEEPRVVATTNTSQSIHPAYVSVYREEAVFVSNAAHWPQDSDLRFDAYVWNEGTRAYELIDLGITAPEISYNVRISASRNGQYFLVKFDSGRYYFIDRVTRTVKSPNYPGISSLSAHISDDGKFVAALTPDNHVAKLTIATGEFQILDEGTNPAPPENSLQRVMFSPNGESVFFTGVPGYYPYKGPGGLFIRTGYLIPSIKQVATGGQMIAVSDSGEQYIYVSTTNKIAFRDDLAQKTVYFPDAYRIEDIGLSGSGEWVIYRTRTNNLYLVNTKTGARRLVTRTANGTEVFEPDIDVVKIAGNGTKVFFSGTIKDIAPGVDRWTSLYEYDIASDSLSLVKMRSEATFPVTDLQAISYDGKSVLYTNYRTERAKDLLRYYAPSKSHKALVRNQDFQRGMTTNGTYVLYRNYYDLMMLRIDDLRAVAVKAPLEIGLLTFRQASRSIRFTNAGYLCDTTFEIPSTPN
ncbi:hypothetical protein MCEMSE15_00205 [Fimbriimonadaceae bacterium]